MDAAPPPPPQPDHGAKTDQSAQADFAPALCVLASGSQGNCSVLRFSDAQHRTRHVLIDLGLSPRRTRALLASAGLELARVDGVIFTHLDHDHAHPGWSSGALAPGTQVLVHKSHLSRGQRQGVNLGRVQTFRLEPFELDCGLRVDPVLNAHDDLGTAAFRFELGGARLGFATDLGRVSDELVTHLHGVDTLAIESNYCPRMQQESDRPSYLKQRIMGGRGHLSNQQAAEAVRAIAPRDHVVLLHLSRQCNRPELVRPLHEQGGYRLTISTQHAPTGWLPIRPADRVRFPAPRLAQPLLFGPAPIPG
jgi:phosphoribosyl 1,2-cyclic phosphodiesterase